MSVPEKGFGRIVTWQRFNVVPSSLLRLGERVGADKVLLAIMLDHILI